jgi:hypothetical protein
MVWENQIGNATHRALCQPRPNTPLFSSLPGKSSSCATMSDIHFRELGNQNTLPSPKLPSQNQLSHHHHGQSNLPSPLRPWRGRNAALLMRHRQAKNSRRACTWLEHDTTAKGRVLAVEASLPFSSTAAIDGRKNPAFPSPLMINNSFNSHSLHMEKISAPATDALHKRRSQGNTEPGSSKQC